MTSATTTRVFKCIPIDNGWIIPGTKLDLKAIYRRPRRLIGEYDEVIQARGEDGRPLYDLVGPLPMRRHSDWIAKGFEYVTVVVNPRREEEKGAWAAVAGSLRAKDLNPADYLQHPQFGTWNPKLYLATAEHADAAKFSELRALVYEMGSEAVLKVRRSMDPSFTLPETLQHIPPGGPVPPAEPAPAAVAPVVDAAPKVGPKDRKKLAEVQG